MFARFITLSDMTAESSDNRFTDALRNRDIRLFLGSTAFFTLASRALAVVIAFQIYKITQSAMSLGWLGLIEAIPAISLSPFGGYIADRFNRQRIILVTRGASCLCAFGLVGFSIWESSVSLYGLYGMIFLAGVARGFADPANSAFEAQIVPQKLTVNASSWISSTWLGCSVIGPAAIGFIFDGIGASGSYLVITGSFAISWALTFAIPHKIQLQPDTHEPVFASIKTGWHYLFRNQPLWTAMVLDLFAVFFGGAIILLPVYASDILHVGAKGLGLLNAAPSLGAMLIMLNAARKPPIERAGRNLLWSITGFGLCMIAFAFSRNFILSMAALFFSGIFDGISMIIRRSMVRLLSPEHLRGRIAAANFIFICASNELGAFESGMGAAWLGAVPCVAAGGVATLAIVAGMALFAKQLRGLRFDLATMERKM
jgi:MFS family permease